MNQGTQYLVLLPSWLQDQRTPLKKNPANLLTFDKADFGQECKNIDSNNFIINAKIFVKSFSGKIIPAALVSRQSGID